MIVDQHAERGPVVEQIIARPASRHDERQNLAIDLALTREFGGGSRRLVQDLRGLVEIGAEPDPQRVGQPDDLAIARHRGERGRVQIGRDDLFAPLERVRPVVIGAQRRRNHLPQLVHGAAGATARRVPEFFDLGGQRAGAAGIRVGDDEPRDLPRGGQREAFPFDRRIALRVFPVEDVAVLDKQHRVDDQARNAGEIGKDPLRELGAVDLAALRVEDAQPGPVLFLVDREQLVVDGLDETGRPPRLALDLRTRAAVSDSRKPGRPV